MTKIDDTYPPVYYSGSPSVLLKHYTRFGNRQKQLKKRQKLVDKDNVLFRIKSKQRRKGRILIDEDLSAQSQNRMDEMELANHNETFNRIIDYDDTNYNFSNEKVSVNI